jgi:DNA-binding transcriptional regulator YiaG
VGDSLAVGIPGDYTLRASGRDLPRRVALVKALALHGVTPRKGHSVARRLGMRLALDAPARAPLPLRVPAVPDPAAFEATLAALGVVAERRLVPSDVDVAAIRTKLGLTRQAFAIRFGSDERTIEAWEQGRHRPEPATRVLLKVIERDPAAVDAALVP